MAKHDNPPPIQMRPINVFIYGGPVGVRVRLEAPQGQYSAISQVCSSDLNNICASFPTIPEDMVAANFYIDDPNSEFYGIVIQLPSGGHQIIVGTFPIPMPPPFNIQCPPLVPLLPAIPDRMKVLGVNLTFQGLTVNTSQYGVLPWFEAALAWLNDIDRKAVYAVKHNAGDTHCIIQLPYGYLYPEEGQPYNNFPYMDWTNGNTFISTKFVPLVVEVIKNGFTPIIFPNEAQDQSLIQMQMIIKALQSYNKDLVPYCILMTGWDGVFYGWPGGPDAVVLWAHTMRGLAPNAYLGIEHDPGHIPLGEGGNDYQNGGRMENFDVIFGEFTDESLSNQGNDTIWQILGRMIRPYNRPSDQIGDPSPPFYLVDSPRGPRTYVSFEYNTRFGAYAWVRGQVSAVDIMTKRNYFKSCGSKYNG